jgi:hypothetical protein
MQTNQKLQLKNIVKLKAVDVLSKAYRYGSTFKQCFGSGMNPV